MKLYSAAHSPFSSRARMAIYAKELPVEILPPPGGGGRSPEWLAINPIGKIPALALPNGVVIPESDTIVEFLADAFPESGLRPSHATDIARSRLISRIVDLYLLGPGLPLIAQMNPQTRDAKIVDTTYAQIEKGFAHLNAFMSDDMYAVGRSLTTADCALVPVLFYMGLFSHLFGKSNPMLLYPRIASYWSRIQMDPAAQKILTEMQDGLRVHMRG